MGAVKAVGNLVGKTVNRGIRTVTGNPKTPPPPPTVRLAAAPASAPEPTAAAITSSVPSISNPFGGGIVSSDDSISSRRASSGSFGLGNLPDTNISLTQPETEREEDPSITVKSPGIEADDEEKRRDALERAENYKIASENY